ncbi:putative peroxygenase 4 isoform X2 [Nicotiana tabacum]|uniref:Peroxygenase 4 isoform X2 n=1 Tax=Nicotiana tabacum TaxID=4097 RepID=A0AC58RYQ0_TOBAC
MASSSSSIDEEGIEKQEVTPLEKHVMFFDINKDGVIYPWETYKGFRKIGSGVLLSTVASIFINIGLSGKTRPAISRFRVDLSQCEVELQKVSGERDALRLLCSQKDEVINDLQADLAKAHEEEAELDKQGKWPSPLFPIEVKNIKFAKHGSDSDVYDTEGRFVPEKFEELFKKHARTNGNALTASELDELLKANKQPKDFAGHIAAKSEWKVLYLLCKDEHGLLPKDTVRSVYDGSLFELMAKAKQSKKHERG